MRVRICVQCMLQVALLSAVSLFLFGCGSIDQHAMASNPSSTSAAAVGASGSTGNSGGSGTGPGSIGTGGGGTGSGGASSGSPGQIVFALNANNISHLNVFDSN